MTEDEVRALAREEIRKAFSTAWERADGHTGYDCGELETAAGNVVKDVTDTVVLSLSPPAPEPVNPFALSLVTWSRPPCQHVYTDAGVCAACDAPKPEPVNPFAPKRTAQEWADDVRNLLEQARADGYIVWWDADGSVSSRAELGLRLGTEDSPPDDDPIVWETK